ncbi:MAG: insecticidal delta-endotoxin Cry8Ea1 family protein [Flavipsychrobacter sp.]|nr:insecticidal delta-endotoxin Cry8Ea1 family protein [Flavipsychrobacter sp.]
METTQKLSHAEVELILNAPPPSAALLAQFTIDNDTAKKIAMAIASKIPYAGGVLSFLMGSFWPTDEVSIWDQIKDQVAALVDQKIAENNLAKLRKDLKGIQINLKNYQKLTDKAQKQSALQSINTTIEAMIPSFLSGDISSGFSCFWGIALLHLAVRKELWELYQDKANEDLLRESTILYSKFGRVALSNIYNGLLDKVIINSSSMNEPGKVSNWRIDVSVIDNGASIFEYHKHFRTNQWNKQTLIDCTVECNNGIAPKWAAIETRTKKDMADWAYDAIVELEKAYTFTETAALALVRDAMEDTDYVTFAKKYYPSTSIYNNPTTTEPKKNTRDPKVQLNPFK